MEAIKFGLDVATNLFSLGTTIAIPSTSIKAVAELGKTVQMIQKTLNVLNATWKLYSGVKTEVGKLWAELHDAELIRLQCYEGLDASHAIYEWNYQRQLLAIRAPLQEQELAVSTL